ncbi:TPM domain-containing protein [Flavobacterium sp. NKUCC04_CG]|uniref:TPM domain-containing protein n=1 Tax=Flavobacterium sp. NKUCC04_CG TaxID=2842121 RepID=UPI001C5A846D|nr:TPM domain-containing protein [Flavobacterium sp. NKUCC04_CG]MBW3517754.1 TPM domain-containing protein [Flavobacterium sp. NKUCC04_CG]
MGLVERFFSEAEEAEIVKAIIKAEENTSGEIRVHLEGHTDLPAFDRAKEVFFDLNMDKTAERNGVLFYLAIEDKSFVIIGDEGIDKKVEADFWDCIKDTVIEHFKIADFKTGLIKGILRSGEKLKAYFPYQKDDVNELPNEISKG